MRVRRRGRYMKVKVDISSVAGGQQFHSVSVGELSIGEDDFSVRYFIEGDECLLEVRGGTVTQRRSGSLTFVMQFKEGASTECVLSEGGQKFAFPVFTQVLGVSLTDEGCTVSLRYLQGGAEQTELVFTASALGKKNSY